MRFSCPEQMLTHYPVTERLRIIQQSGFDGIDCRFSTLEEPDFSRQVKDSGLSLASVYSQVRTPSLLDASAADRAKAVSDVVHRATLAADCGADNLILVPVFGEPRLSVDSPLDDIIELETALLIVSLKEIAESLRTVPISIVIEPLNQGETHFLTNPGVAANICGRVNSPNVLTMVDTYHCHQENLDIPGQIREVDEFLGLVHVSDSERGLPGEGEIDFVSTLQTLTRVGYDGWTGFECRPISGDDDVRALTSALQLLKSQIQAY